MNVNPGWYPNPDNSGGWRWWNGAAWSGYTTPQISFTDEQPDKWDQGWHLAIRVAAIIFAAIGTLVFLASVAGAKTADPGISPEYTWMNDVPTALAEQAAAAPDVPVVAPDVTVAPVTVESPVNSGGVVTDPDLVHEMRDPVHYTGPVIATGVPGGVVVTDHAVGAPSDPRVLHCTGGASFGAGGTFPAASISQPGLVDSLIAQGVCAVVN